MEIIMDKQGNMTRKDGKPLKMSEKDRREAKRFMNYIDLDKRSRLNEKTER